MPCLVCPGPQRSGISGRGSYVGPISVRTAVGGHPMKRRALSANVLFSAIVLVACSSNTTSRVVTVPPTPIATATPTSTPTPSPNPTPTPKPRPAATPTPPFWGQLGGTGGDTFLAVTGVPIGASCEARSFGEPPNSNIVLTAPWNAAVNAGSGKYQVTWTKGGNPPSNIVWPSRDKMVWPSPSPPGSALQSVMLRWKTLCTRQGFTSPWVAIPGSFSFGPPS